MLLSSLSSAASHYSLLAVISTTFRYPPITHHYPVPTIFPAATHRLPSNRRYPLLLDVYPLLPVATHRLSKNYRRYPPSARHYPPHTPTRRRPSSTTHRPLPVARRPSPAIRGRSSSVRRQPVPWSERWAAVRRQSGACGRRGRTSRSARAASPGVWTRPNGDCLRSKREDLECSKDGTRPYRWVNIGARREALIPARRIDRSVGSGRGKRLREARGGVV